MLKNNNFVLRLVEEDDLVWVKTLRENPDTNKFLGTFCLLNDSMQKTWFNSLQSDKSKCYMIFEKFNDISNEKIGMVRITEIDLINKSMCVGGDIDPKHRGNGYAKEMFKLIFKYGFDYMNMNRLYLYVLEDNNVAKSLYKKMGFTYEGVQREAIFSEGKYKDYEMMSILKREYLSGGFNV